MNTYIETMMNASQTTKSYSKNKSKQNKMNKIIQVKTMNEWGKNIFFTKTSKFSNVNCKNI